ncbi:MAG TPA: hypothetical protein VMV86_02050 [Methanosarcinales archaeon]|nr:hypothetical protein [Methanosarcinales archaeon]
MFKIILFSFLLFGCVTVPERIEDVRVGQLLPISVQNMEDCVLEVKSISIVTQLPNGAYMETKPFVCGTMRCPVSLPQMKNGSACVSFELVKQL